jgi:signal transduction histidine kinase
VIRWIQQSRWLPELLLGSFVFLLFGGLDLITGGLSAMVSSLAIAISLLFVRNFSYLTSIALLSAGALQIIFGLVPVFGSLGIVLVAYVVGAFSPRPWREINLVVAIFTGLAVAANFVFNPSLNLAVFGLVQLTDVGRLTAFLAIALLAVSMVTLAWLFGLLLITRLMHVGTDFDRMVYEEKQLKLSIELAEQAKRFEIARDINEHLVQSMAGVISNAEGGVYAAKSNPEAGIRALEKILSSARSAHAELRRLFDMINRGTIVASAPPTLAELEDLAISMREVGLDVAVESFGKAFDLEPTAELAIYRIVFESLQNVKQHNPRGTKATVEISWLENGVQVMIKDNGIEVVRRANIGVDGLPEPYDANDDLDNLLEKVTGPGLTAMRERAESYGGSLEVQRMVGIGFTVSAMFPKSEVAAASHGE